MKARLHRQVHYFRVRRDSGNMTQVAGGTISKDFGNARPQLSLKHVPQRFMAA
jgi:hypothetical protein